ncbi:hypothetical protein [Salinisphaera orenii]|uniref:hypothetical protein n=1 Tax=Salinisphaera orenii TaxID=856731 RepID=UPI000DBE5D02
MESQPQAERLCILLELLRVDTHVVSALMGIVDFEIRDYEDLKQFSNAAEPEKLDHALNMLRRLGGVTMSESGQLGVTEMSADQSRQFQEALRRAATAQLAEAVSGQDVATKLREARES